MIKKLKFPKSKKFILPDEIFVPGDRKPILGGLRRKLSPCCGASVITSGGGLRREICSKCRRSIRENRLR